VRTDRSGRREPALGWTRGGRGAPRAYCAKRRECHTDRRARAVATEAVILLGLGRDVGADGNEPRGSRQALEFVAHLGVSWSRGSLIQLRFWGYAEIGIL